MGGALKCWGHNQNGQLGNGNTDNQSAPLEVTGFSTTGSSVSAGDKHTCAVTVTGSVQCWGANANGQLGDGTLMERLAPVQVTGLTVGVAAVDTGSGHTCALTTAGGVKCWGNNVYGQLGYKQLWVPQAVTNQSTRVFLPQVSR